MKHRIGKALAVSAGSVVLSVLATICVEFLINGGPSLAGFAISMVVPLIVAFPISLYVFHKNDQLRTALEQLHLMHKKARKMATLDLMTGLLNRNSFIARFENRRRKADQGALLMMDLDHFKAINDTFGHLKGDAALLLVVDCLSRCTRKEDVLGRLGGEEFGVFLTNVDDQQAHILADRIREAVAAIKFEPRPGVIHPLTISIGLVMARGGQPFDDLMHIADERMYAAKQSGRNRVVVDLAPELVQGVA